MNDAALYETRAETLLRAERRNRNHFNTDAEYADWVYWRIQHLWPDEAQMTATDTERQARSRKARAEAGGKQVAVMLTPAAAAKLAAWLLRGLSATQAINRLLERSKP